MSTHGALFRQAGKNKLLLAATVLLSLAGAGLMLAQARGIAGIINAVFLSDATLNMVAPVFAILAAIILLRGLTTWGTEVASARLALGVKEDLRALAMAKLLRLGPKYLEGEQSGELTGTITQGIESIDSYFSQFIPQVILAVLIPLMILVLVFPLDWLSGLTLLLTAPLIPFFLYLIGRATERVTGTQFAALSRMSAFFRDTLYGLATLKQFGNSRQRLEEVGAVNEDYRKATMQVLQVTFLSALALEMLGTICTALVAVQIGLRLLHGGIPYEQALFILIITPEFYLPLRNLGLRFHAAMNGVNSAGRIFAILYLPEMEWKSGDAAEPRMIGTLADPSRAFQIEFRNVSYRHPDRSQQVLQDINFHIPQGKTTALVGASGAGKTTIAQLLLGFLTPDAGEILVDGKHLQEIPLDLWRQQIAWVPQQAGLVEDTVLANILLANPQADMVAVEEAARQAGIDGLIQALPQGYLTRVGEGGARFSGGERNRLALARAFLRDASFLILDEPTANLDVELEEQIQRSIQELCREKTVLLIAHRLNTIRSADQVLEISSGRAADISTPTKYLQKVNLSGREGNLL